MSIYASLRAPSDDHAETCAIWIPDPKFGDGGLMEGDPSLCSCKLRHAPIVYKGSHVLPSLTDERGGWLDIALIPGFVQREGRESEQPDNDEMSDYPAWPFLRFGVNESTVVLDQDAVGDIVGTLTYWLEHVGRSEDAP
jgi:hypothetical protein